MNDAYEILSGEIKVAVWQNERLTVLNHDLLPFYFQINQNLKAWLTTRAADHRRPHIRLLKKALRLTARDDISTVIHVNGATITDNYWIRPLGSDLAYDDVRFTDDYFSNLALKGNYDSFNRAASSKRSKTPELTNMGLSESESGKLSQPRKGSGSFLFRMPDNSLRSDNKYQILITNYLTSKRIFTPPLSYPLPKKRGTAHAKTTPPRHSLAPVLIVPPHRPSPTHRRRGFCDTNPRLHPQLQECRPHGGLHGQDPLRT